jgi:glycosyltransferase involved in cell wall biosynthesis
LSIPLRNSLITVLIVARNAAATIERAVLSVVGQSRARILLVDDFSTDQTSFLALQAAGGQCSVVRPPLHGALGATRAFGLSKVTSKYTILLDADDAYLPGRIDRAVKQLEQSQAQIWADGVRLRDGASGSHLKDIPIPTFLKHSPVPYRLFERNYLPGVGQVALVTGLAQQVGYDPTLHGPEDIDLVLRLVASGARIAYNDDIGYEMFAYSTSVSRSIDNQLAMYARGLRKFSLPFIRSFYLQHGSDIPTAIWACVSAAIYCGAYEAAVSLLDELDATLPITSATYVHEPDGPNPFPEQWRRCFLRGTAQLLLGQDHVARRHLQKACDLLERPESFNNLGVVERRLGLEEEALASFQLARGLNGEFVDAQRNLGTATSQRITRLPLRVLANRSSYS